MISQDSLKVINKRAVTFWMRNASVKRKNMMASMR